MFRVRIHYREPTYELRSGSRDRPFHWTYRVSAENAQAAQAQAVREFRQMTRLSSVGWTREIVLIELENDRAA